MDIARASNVLVSIIIQIVGIKILHLHICIVSILNAVVYLRQNKLYAAEENQNQTVSRFGNKFNHKNP